MQQITITKIFTKEAVSKTGKPYTSMSIKANEYGEKWISGFKGKENANWKEGDKVEVIIDKKQGTDKNGNPTEYLNYSVPKAEDKTKEDLMKISLQLSHIKLVLAQIAGAVGIDTPFGSEGVASGASNVPQAHRAYGVGTSTQPAKVGGTDIDYPEDDINPEDIPF